MSFLYLGALVISLVGLGLLDFRHKLAFFGGAGFRSAAILVLSVAFFLVWDVVGIATGVFFRGSGPWMTGVLLGPERPEEEVFDLQVRTSSTLGADVWAASALEKRRQ
jgi:lycopene cyclase domain-containing protein